ncbi:hypothetical protein [Maribacter sp. 2308TA10-17]|uniref:hypothetical protein n=1 Tax=Maribacter sp. 2308TA10-17 TaxID=3386276 RepID=UPI0039BD1164
MKIATLRIDKTIFLVIGLILLGILVIFEFQDRIEEKTQKEKALIALKQEIESNAQILSIWMEWDEQTTTKLDTLLNKIHSDNTFLGRLPTRFLEKKKRGISTNQSIYTFSDGVWKALLDSGRAKDLDFEVLHTLENLYGSQETLVEVCQDIPVIHVSSILDRKFGYEDLAELYRIRLLFGRIGVAESYLESHFTKTFNSSKFEQEEVE